MDSGKASYANGVPSKPVPKVRPDLHKAPELPVPEARNWLIHLHFARKDFGICKILVQEELDRNNGRHEFASYVQGMLGAIRDRELVSGKGSLRPCKCFKFDGVILRHEGKVQSSLECFQMCRVMNPKNVDNIKQVAKSYFLLGAHKLALEAYQDAEDQASSPEWDIYHNKGQCYMRLGNFEKGVECLRKAIQLNRNERSFVALARIYLMSGDIKGLIEMYTAALEASPDSADLAITIGLLYLKLHDNQRALEKFGSALARDPLHAKALIAAGAMMQRHSDYDVALSKYKMAAISWPESAVLWNNVGMCFFGKKKFVAAVSCLKRAHYLSPIDWTILFNLGLVHMATQQYASAFHFLSAALNLEHMHASTYHYLGVVLRYLNDFENAREAFEQALSEDPHDPEIAVNFSILLYEMGDKDSAVEQLGRFQELALTIPRLDPQLIKTATKQGAVLGQKKRKSVKEDGENDAAQSTGTSENVSPSDETPRNDLTDDEV